MGFHIHAAFFFNGAGVRKDCLKARQIGELWEQITRGQGYFHSSNDDKERYGDKCGIGTFKRADPQALHKVCEAMHYLTEDGQHLRIKPAGARAFRTGFIRREG
ncbi:hypothetical protein [Pseudomonas cavernicola]